MKVKKRLISAHCWRVAADFTGREKYKTPSRAHGCFRRAGEREGRFRQVLTPGAQRVLDRAHESIEDSAHFLPFVAYEFDN